MGSQPEQLPDQEVSINAGGWAWILEGRMQNRWGRVLRVKKRSRLVLEVLQENKVWIVELDSRWVAASAPRDQ
jgi:hypothetical protein